MKPIRLATLKSTGHVHVVRAFFPDSQQYRLWGEVVGTQGRNRVHGDDLLVSRVEVDVVEAEMTPDLHNRLVRQGVDALRAGGRRVHETRGGNFRIWPAVRS